MYLGITGYSHESSAALVDDKGNLVNYYREESLSRIKGDKSFPKRALNRIFETNDLNYEQINSIAFYERPLTAFLTTLKTAALNIPRSLPLIVHQCRNFDKSSISCFLDISKLYPGLEKKLHYLDHHLSHTLTALPYSSIQKDICSIVIDGFGDRSTSSISKLNNKFDIKELWSCDYPYSLGLYYSAITDFLGFQINEGEYKVMGLSAFGDSNSNEAKKVSNLIHWDRKNKKIVLDMNYFSFHVSPTNSYSKKLVDLLGEPRNPFISLYPEDKNFQFYANIARGAQDAVLRILIDIFEFAHSLTGSRIFCFSGGVAMNSAALNKIATLEFVDQIVIPPSPGDAGSSIGAAYYAYLKTSSKVVNQIPKPTLFPSIFDSSKQIKLANKIITKNFIQITNSIDKTIAKVAELIKEGHVIGFVIKNAETGPRALGNRSLICDGKNKIAVKLLNTVIKNRSPFRPTAPCMKYEVAKKYYDLREELIDSYLSMSATCNCKKDNISLNFPTTHVDGSARLQIVEKGNIIYELLNQLEKFNIEILANSSLNVSGDPTCYDLIDSLLVSARTPLRYLVTDLGLIEKIDSK